MVWNFQPDEPGGAIMRIISSIGLGLVVLTGLAACGKSDEAVRNEARTQLTASCPRSATPEITAMLQQSGLTIEQVCTCTIDRYMRTATVAQIKEDSGNPAPARISAASSQCLTELVAAQSHGAPATEAAPAADAAGQAAAPAEAGGEAENAAH
jgi:hypothetical protein